MLETTLVRRETCLTVYVSLEYTLPGREDGASGGYPMRGMSGGSGAVKGCPCHRAAHARVDCHRNSLRLGSLLRRGTVEVPLRQWALPSHAHSHGTDRPCRVFDGLLNLADLSRARLEIAIKGAI